MKKVIYFGHPVNFYNTEIEANLIECIKAKFPEFNIENPNQKIHQQGYQKWKRIKGNGMIYYFKEVLPCMDAGVFLPFEDKMLGADVFKEATFLDQLKKPIYEISLEEIIIPLVLNPKRVLSVEQTKARVY